MSDDEDNASTATHSTSKLRKALDYEATKKHKSWLHGVTDDNNGRLYSERTLADLREFIQIVQLRLRAFEPAYMILSGALKRDSDQLAIFQLDIERFDDVQTTLGVDLWPVKHRGRLVDRSK